MKELIPKDIRIGIQYFHNHYDRRAEAEHPEGEPEDGAHPENRTHRRLAYFTYTQGYSKAGEAKINKQTSWNDWRSEGIEPIVLENHFVEGWRIENDFNVRSWRSNRKMFIITEPRTGYQFEADVSIMVPMLMNCQVIDGVVQGRYALTKDRALISEADFEKYSQSHSETVNEKSVAQGDIVEAPNGERLICIGRYHIYSRKNWNQDPSVIEHNYSICFIPESRVRTMKDHGAWYITRASFKYYKVGEISQEEWDSKFSAVSRYMMQAKHSTLVGIIRSDSSEEPALKWVITDESFERYNGEICGISSFELYEVEGEWKLLRFTNQHAGFGRGTQVIREWADPVMDQVERSADGEIILNVTNKTLSKEQLERGWQPQRKPVKSLYLTRA